MWSTLFTLFSLLVSNIGLSMIIKVSLPVLSALYPVAIILVFLSLLHTVFSGKFPRVYFWTVLCVGIVSVAQCVASMAVVFGGGVSWLESALAVLPLDAFQLGWVVPAAIGAVVGVVDSLVRVRRSVATR
jgi:LIVCS family branched-chain amino acid:cation transporter